MLESTEAKVTPEDIQRAAERIAPFIRETPCDESEFYSRRYGVAVHLKRENLQQTSSFKVRGALNKVLSLDSAVRELGLVAASTGNHGAAVAWAAQKVGASVTVFAPESADDGKLAPLELMDAKVQRIPGDPIRAELAARAEAESTGKTYVSPYNDPLVVAGQGTVGLEIAAQVPEVRTVVCAVGGGGLISGVALGVKSIRPGTRVFGASPAASPVLMRSVEAGDILELPSDETLSDSTAGGVEAGAVTFDLARVLVDEWRTVDEGEIGHALRRHLAIEHELIEGAAAVSLALAERREFSTDDAPLVIVLCGANISLETLRRVLA